MIYLTGDIHGSDSIDRLSRNNFPVGNDLSKEDYVIILGDFGLVWSRCPEDEETYWLDWLSSKPWTTLVVPGNHENWDLIYELDEVNMFGSKIRKVNDSVYMFNRGDIYNIDGYSFFTMGGAYSIDKHKRKANISWWEKEQPSYSEYVYGLNNLEKYNWKVDYILGHTCPRVVANEYCNHRVISKHLLHKCSVMRFFDEVITKVDFSGFYFGHWHDDMEFQIDNKRYIMMYNDIKKLGE